MSRNNANTPRTRKHSSRTNSSSKQSRSAFHRLPEASNLTSNRNSSAQSEDDIRILKNSVKRANCEDKDSLLKKLTSQVKELKHKIKVLEECVDNKDYSLAILTREKDRALGEIRRLERSNRQLKQQLNDERNYYIEEKEKFCEEMSKHKKRFQELKHISERSKSLSDSLSVVGKTSARAWQKGDAPEIRSTKGFFRKLAQLDNLDYLNSHSLINFGPFKGQDLTLQLAALKMENAQLRGLVSDGEEKNHELCLRFLRMKHSKRDLRIRFQDLENEYLQIINNLMEKIDEAREEFNVVVDQKCRKPMRSTDASIVKANRRNSKTTFDNARARTEEKLQGETAKEGARSSTEETFGGKYSGVDHKSFSASDATGQLTDVKSKPSIGSGAVRLGPSENPTEERSSETDSNGAARSASDHATGVAEVTSAEVVSDGFESRSDARDRAANPRIHVLSDDILNKIFKRIDSQLSMGAAKEAAAAEKFAENSKDRKSYRDPERFSGGKCSVFEKNFKKRFIMCCMNSKKFHEITGPVAKKKESNSDGRTEDGQPTTESAKPKKKTDKMGKCKADIIGLAWDGRIRARWKPRAKGCRTDAKESFRSRGSRDRGQNSRGEVEETGVGSGRNRSGETASSRRENTDNIEPTSSSPRPSTPTEDAGKRALVHDGCVLRRRLDSDLSADRGNVRSARNGSGEKCTARKAPVDEALAGLTGRKCSAPKEGSERMACHEALSKDDLASDSDDSTAEAESSSTSRNRNSVTLYDELMEVSKTQIQSEDDPFWQRAWNHQPTPPKNAVSPSRRYWVMHEHSTFLSEGFQRRNPRFLDNSDEEERLYETTKEEDAEELRKASERQMKSTGSPGSKSLSPPKTHRKTVSANSNNENDAKSETVLRFLMQPSAIESSQSLSLGRDESRRNSQTSRSDSGKPSSPQEVQRQAFHLALPSSNVPSSCSTMADSSGGRDDGLTTRILSAPALLESEWLNTFRMCEMKDCSTNT